MKKLLLCAALPAMVAACATDPEADVGNSAAARREQNEYITGSNLPRKNRMGGDNVSTMTADEFDRARTSGPGNAAGTPGGQQ
jgi:hypothetical protein